MNNITIELCAEDRARLDKLTAALEKRAEQTDKWAPVPESIQEPAAAPEAKQTKPTKKKATAPTEEPTAAPETPAPITDTPEEEKPTEEPTAPAEKVAPSVTFEQIQQKVVQLAAGFGGTKKAQVREVINGYGAKVSDLKEQPDKWDEVWDKLTALESEA